LDIKVTNEHKFLTPYSFKKLSELKVGDSIAIPKKICIKNFKKKQLPTDLCRFVGYLLGDGGLTNQRSINWTESDQTVIDDGLVICKKYFPRIVPKLNGIEVLIK